MNAPTVTLYPELEVFERHRFELLEHSAGKYVLIKGTEIIGTFETEAEAIRDGYQRFGNDAFLVQHILEADVPLNFASFNLGV